ncbi:unnamed protein product [Ilex paraguariensis]|uniref:Uncharacterized protein n=1 Tax=Ilex paraguariensis TaxID=185542 RepID=A0ABC8SVM8_9AQUA
MSRRLLFMPGCPGRPDRAPGLGTHAPGWAFDEMEAPLGEADRGVSIAESVPLGIGQGSMGAKEASTTTRHDQAGT